MSAHVVAVDYLPLPGLFAIAMLSRERQRSPCVWAPENPRVILVHAGLSVEAIRWSRIFFLLCSDVVIFYLIKSQREIFVNEDL